MARARRGCLTCGSYATAACSRPGSRGCRLIALPWRSGVNNSQVGAKSAKRELALVPGCCSVCYARVVLAVMRLCVKGCAMCVNGCGSGSHLLGCADTCRVSRPTGAAVFQGFAPPRTSFGSMRITASTASRIAHTGTRSASARRDSPACGASLTGCKRRPPRDHGDAGADGGAGGEAGAAKTFKRARTLTTGRAHDGTSPSKCEDPAAQLCGNEATRSWTAVFTAVRSATARGGVSEVACADTSCRRRHVRDSNVPVSLWVSFVNGHHEDRQTQPRSSLADAKPSRGLAMHESDDDAGGDFGCCSASVGSFGSCVSTSLSVGSSPDELRALAFEQWLLHVRGVQCPCVLCWFHLIVLPVGVTPPATGCTASDARAGELQQVTPQRLRATSYHFDQNEDSY